MDNENPEQPKPQERAPASEAKPEAAPQAPASQASANGGWEREVLEKVLLAAIAEQRAGRRWGIFFKSAFLLLILGALAGAWFYSKDEGEAFGAHTALVAIDGEIEADAPGA